MSRFNAPGGIETMGRGYLDFKSSEFSPYNSLLNRNLTVIKPSQGPTGSYSEAIGSGTAGIRVSDIHGKDFGLRSHLARHSARFGRDSMFVTSSDDLPGASYDQLPSLHKVNRNRLVTLKISNDGDVFSPKTMTTVTASKHDNFYVQHPIPRSDIQYSWITSSVVMDGERFYEFNPAGLPGYFSSSISGYISYFDFVSASNVVPELIESLYQPISRLNILAFEPLTSSTNVLGLPDTSPGGAYLNTTLINKLGVSSFITSSAAYLNLILSKRRAKFGTSWNRLRIQDHPILINEKLNNKLSTIEPTENEITVYDLPPVSMRSRPLLLNFDTPDNPI